MIAVEQLDAVPVQEGDTFSLTFIANKLSEYQERAIRYFSDSEVRVDRLTPEGIDRLLAENDITLGMAISPGSAAGYTMGGTFLAAGASAYRAIRGLLLAAAAAGVSLAAVSFTQNSEEISQNAATVAQKGISILWLLILLYAIYKWETRGK